MSIAWIHAATVGTVASATSRVRETSTRRVEDAPEDQRSQEVDRATFSDAALALSRASTDEDGEPTDETNSNPAQGTTDKSREDGVALTAEEQRQVQKLQARDAEVRAHEAAHMAAGGSHVRGGASYTYQQGPDGKSYAIGGEVGIDVSPVRGNPQATIQKMQQIRAAALAPSEPSGADRAVAAKAAQLEAQASAELSPSRTRAAPDPYRTGPAEPSTGLGFNETA